MDGSNTTELRELVAKSGHFLDNIKSILSGPSYGLSDTINVWLREVNRIKRQCPLPQTIIGVIGATGSGKSSIINALLGEEQLVPTSCIQACTSVVTEISYNEDVHSEYRAEVHPLSHEEWRDELNAILNDLVIDGKISGEARDENSEAGIALAKVQAVYPHLRKSDIPKTTVNDLLNHQHVKDVINSKPIFSASTAKLVYEKIHKFIDGAENLRKAHEPEQVETSISVAGAAYWPLIRKVCVYTKSPVLQDGTVLVDLPGTADSNAARNVVARRYLQNCDSLWIVAPIIRAVNDKTARHLLGEAFKRQLWRDGILQRVTIICSKTDDMDLSEALNDLEKHHQYRCTMHAFGEEVSEVARRTASVEHLLSELADNMKSNTRLIKELGQEEKIYTKLLASAKSGTTVHPYIRFQGGKRSLDVTLSDTNSPPPKRARNGNQATLDVDTPQTPVSAMPVVAKGKVEFRPDYSQKCLSVNDIEKILSDLTTRKHSLEKERHDLTDEEYKLQEVNSGLKVQKKEVIFRAGIACLRARNNLSAASIRQDYAAGVRDLSRCGSGGENEEIDIDVDDEEGHVPDAEEEVSKALPVFCVSARGFHKLSGRMRNQTTARLFESVDDTGVPDLQKHARRLGQGKISVAAQHYIDATQRLRMSLKLWSSGKGGTNEVNEILASEFGFRIQLVDSLISNIRSVAQKAIDELDKSICTDLVDVLQSASSIAAAAAVPIAMRWVAPRTADNPTPGMFLVTFRSVIALGRDGEHTVGKPPVHYNFNSNLMMPYTRHVDRAWHETFNTKIQRIESNATEEVTDLCAKFKKSFGDRLEHTTESHVDDPAREFFDTQMKAYENELHASFQTVSSTVTTKQREANRLFESTVQSAMMPIYAELREMRGNRVYHRIRQKLRNFVEEKTSTIFDEITEQVSNKLQATVEEVRTAAADEISAICNSMERDCKNLVQESCDFDELEQQTKDAIIACLQETDCAHASCILDGTAAIKEEEVDVANIALDVAQHVDDLDNPNSHQASVADMSDLTVPTSDPHAVGIIVLTDSEDDET